MMASEAGSSSSENFNWDAFWAFTGRQRVFNRLLYQLHYRQYEKLLKGLQLDNIAFLELGAGTGIIAQRLIRKFGGHGVFVDQNELAYRMFLQTKQAGVDVAYLKANIFDIELDERFDLVCSDGLIEHYRDKSRVLELHRRFVKPTGHIIIFVPKKSWFISCLQHTGPTFGYEELFTLSDLVGVCSSHELNVIRSVDYFFEVGVLCAARV